ncbi:MAG: hypothetical protein IJ062_11980 [Firmicutes bacterium]|nr:hypothetical protein [Bacillota bacterium]
MGRKLNDKIHFITIILVLVIGIFKISEVSAEDNYHNEIYYYDMGIDVQDYIANNLSMNNLHSLKGNLELFKFSEVGNSLVCESDTHKFVDSEIDDEFGVFWSNGYYLNNSDFIKYLDESYLAKFLLRNGIDCKIKERCILNLAPMIIYIDSDIGDFLITVECYDYDSDLILYDDYRNMNFLSKDEYKNMFSLSWKDLHIDDKNVTSVLFATRYHIYVPIRYTIGSYVDDIIWDEETRSVNLLKDKKVYILKHLDDTGYLYLTGNEMNDWKICDLPQTYPVFYNDRIYISIDSFIGIMNGLGIDLDYYVMEDGLYIEEIQRSHTGDGSMYELK